MEIHIWMETLPIHFNGKKKVDEQEEEEKRRDNLFFFFKSCV